MATEYLNKTQAIALIGIETGYGRRIIEKMMDQLEEAGKIKIVPHLDGRTLLVTRTDIDIIIQALKDALKTK